MALRMNIDLPALDGNDELIDSFVGDFFFLHVFYPQTYYKSKYSFWAKSKR